MVDIDINRNISLFLNGDGNKIVCRTADSRYASFDYCYNYFQDFKEHRRIEQLSNNNNIQNSCLQLGFYLASWGMFRGSSFLLKNKSVKFFEFLIRNISQYDQRIWNIDVDDYNDENIQLIIDCKQMIKETFEDNFTPTKVLISKIMLGVFGNVPAFDGNFRKGLRISTFSNNSLRKIRDFYYQHRSILDDIEIFTIDYNSGSDTTRTYPKAKLIDMVGFVEGMYLKH